MGLDKKDRIREHLSLGSAYLAIHEWYRGNRGQLKTKEWYPVLIAQSEGLIDAVPAPQKATELEMLAIMSEVITGAMEWAYHQSDGKHKMAAYAHAALESLGRDYRLSEAEINELKGSALWPYLRWGGID